MRSLNAATASLLRGGVTASAGPEMTARLALDDATRSDAYAIRHASYLHRGFIDPQPGGLFSDADDLAPNNRSIVVYKADRPAASVRLCTLDLNPALTGWAEIPARRIYPEAVADLAANSPDGRPARLTEISRLVRHPDFADDVHLVFMLFRLAAFMVAQDGSDMTLSCVRRHHMPFYKKLHFDYITGPRSYPGLKFETNLMACKRNTYQVVASDVPYLGMVAGPNSSYAGLLRGETVRVFDAA